MKLYRVMSCFTALFLLTSQMAFGQQAQPKKQRPDHYQTLFEFSDKIAALAKVTCKSEECTQAITELTAVIADGRDKHSKKMLVADTRTQFHSDFKTSMTKLRKAVIADMSDEEKAAMAKRPECPACDKPPSVRPVQNGTQAQCQQCLEVLHATAEICGLYLGTCNTCALICLSVAALSYGNCISMYCAPENPPGGFNDN